MLLAVADAFAWRSPFIPRMATAFCSGLSRSRGPCGALMGGVLAVSLAHGRDAPSGDLMAAYAPSQELIDGFRDAFGSIDCAELLGLDLSTDEGRAAFAAGGYRESHCARFVALAAAMASQLAAWPLDLDGQTG
ncbi:C-GCAxxG-C-C family protein [Desulfohalovibrio reitneri]|uniref:C-GCAxxG-C-C family protein n=1 Tax=Desulfohalovibrio reitneri TaxID=1307759 RepID=UPI000A477F18|nr:C-GCAxxG-C-C family protein [Desulfohalovibrio reitneri]